MLSYSNPPINCIKISTEETQTFTNSYSNNILLAEHYFLKNLLWSLLHRTQDDIHHLAKCHKIIFKCNTKFNIEGKHNLCLGNSFYEVIQERGAELWSNLGTAASLPDGKSQEWHICSWGEGCCPCDSLPTPHQLPQPCRRFWLPSSCRGKADLQAAEGQGLGCCSSRWSRWSQQARAHRYITESWNGWVGRDLEDHLVLTPLPQEGTPSTRAALIHTHVNTDRHTDLIFNAAFAFPEVHFVSFLAVAVLQNHCNQG